MASSSRDKAVQAHRCDRVQAHRGGEIRAWSGRATVRPVARLDGHTSFGHDGERPETEARLPDQGRPKRAGWNQRRLAIGGLVVALLVAAVGGIDWLARVPVPAQDATGPVLVVWRAPGPAPARISAVERNQWQAFVASRLTDQAQNRVRILGNARAEMAAALVPVFQDMKGRVKDYVGWFYFFPTTYRFAFTAVIAMLSQDKSDPRSSEHVATEALNRLLQDRFVEVVVAPERFGPTVEAKAREVLQHAIAAEQAVAEGEAQALAGFMANHGREVEDSQGFMVDRTRPVVLSWEALGLPASAAAMAAPPDPIQTIKNDPALEPLQTTAPTEGMMLVARQIARRMVNSAVSNAAQTMVVPMIAGSALGPVEALVSPALGIAAFGVGVTAEFGAVKLRQTIEGPRLTELSESVVDQLQAHQSHVLSDAVAQRIETWLGG